MDNLMKHAASAQSDILAQKNTLQQEAQLGETAAEVAAKLPVSPETVIEAVMTGRKIRSQLQEYAVPIAVGLFAVVAAAMSYQMYAQKSKQT